jgi:hypothetical protein
MWNFDAKDSRFTGPGGQLAVPPDDEITRKLAMLVEGECGRQPRAKVARKYGYSRQRYFQLRRAFQARGAAALASRKRGPKTHYRRTAEVVRQVIRYRFLNPDLSVDVIAQKLRQQGRPIAARSVQRVIEEYGLQKKTLRPSSRRRAPLG